MEGVVVARRVAAPIRLNPLHWRGLVEGSGQLWRKLLWRMSQSSPLEGPRGRQNARGLSAQSNLSQSSPLGGLVEGLKS